MGLAACGAGDTASAQPATPAATERPRIGLVLSGGGARGGAHLGVLKVLEELRVPVDVVVGTSAGSIVGAAYASGMPLADIEAEMRTLSTATLFHDVDRTNEPMRRKADDALNFIGPEIGFGPNGISLPKGAIAGVSLEAVLRRLTVRQRDEDFDRLPIPFRAVATDLTTSEMVVLGRGSLAAAIRASMAIPAAVNPVEIGGRLLVDGGVVRNLPVDVARSLGAQVVIAVNIGTPLRKREEIVSLLSVSDQMTRILTARNVSQSLQELEPGDVLISPDLGSVSTADFDRLSEAAAAGEAATRAAAGALERHRLDADAYARLAASRGAGPQSAPARIDEIRIVGTERVNEEMVRGAMSTRLGELFDAAVADADLKRIYASGDFERVGYYLDEQPGGGHVLTADVTEKSWGPHYLRFGLALSTDFAGNSYFNALASHRWTWLNRLGAEWRNDIQIGRVERLRTEWHQPLSPAQRWFTSVHAEVEREPFDLYFAGERIARFKRHLGVLGADLGVPIGRAGEARVGLLRGRVKFGNEVGFVPDLELPSDDLGALTLQLRLDTLDSLRFPRFGYAADIRLLRSRRSFGASSDYNKINVGLRGAYSIGSHTLRIAATAAQAVGDGELPVHELSWLGGFLQLSGYRTGEFVGVGSRFVRVVYNYRLGGPGFLEGMFAGVSAEAGRIGDAVRGPNAVATLHGNAIYFGVDTPLGPLYIAYGRASSDNRATYLFLGQP